MLFNSIEFIFIFLPIVFTGYFILAAWATGALPRLLWLTGASFAFYAYWNVKFVPIVLISIGCNYCFGLLISRQSPGRKRDAIFTLSIVSNLAALCYFKYLNFFMTSVAAIAHLKPSLIHVVLPLGISFFTFTQIAYLIDLYRGHKAERDLVKYALFVTYFPHLIAGPILHHKEMMWQFASQERSRFSSVRFAVGLSAFALGLFKKTIVADLLARLVNPVFSIASTGVPQPIDAWGGSLAYSLQIYFDFSGYCDMALGLSIILGIALPFNFDSPYKARSIVDFWRRWHITLSRFLRDYLYIALGGNRKGGGRRYANLLITMLLGGLWHGAGVTFIIWGGLHGAFLSINHAWHGLRARMPLLDKMGKSPLFVPFAYGLTQLCAVIAWVFFRAEDLKQAKRLLAAMFSVQAPTVGALGHSWQTLFLMLAGYIFCAIMPNINDLFAGRELGIDTYRSSKTLTVVNVTWRPTMAWGVGLALLTVVALLAVIKSGAGSPFLYFQF